MNFADLLDTLGFTGGEFVSLLTLDRDGNPHSRVVDAAQAAEVAAGLSGPDRNAYFGVCPTRGPARENAGRGTAVDVTRLSGLWIDLDVKPGGCADYGQARAIIAVLSEMLGTAPSAIVRTGHGLQPYWPIEDGALGAEHGHLKATALLRRFRRLVDRVAEAHGAKVDNVFELARQLRLPDSFNIKDTDPIAVVAEQAPGAPLTVAQIDEALLAQGVVEEAGDRTDRTTAAEAVSTPAGWEYTTAPCQYAVQAIKAWRTDTPPKGRHQWMLAQLTRLAAFHRAGCLTAELHAEGRRAIADRFAEMCNQGIGGDPRPVKVNAYNGTDEVSEAVPDSIRWASAMSDDHLDGEVGRHLPHLWQMAPGSSPEPLTSTNSPASPADGSPGGQAGQPAPAPAPQAAQPGLDALTQWQRTDAGNADRMAARHADRLRYCPDMGRWLVWDGARWEMHADDSPAWQAAREAIESIKPADDDIAKHMLRSLATTKLQAMIAQARRQAAMMVRVDQLDADPYKLNTPDGVVDLRTGELLGVDPDGWHTKTTGVGFSRAGHAPEWSRFLRDTFGDDIELVAYMRRLAGYAALGAVTAHVLPFLFGSGANGKSVFLDVLKQVLGDYAIVAPATFLLAGRDDKHETEIARLRGARLVICSEINRGSKFDEAKVKALTGGDPLTGRFMRQDFFDFMPSHTLFLAGNHQPEVSAGGTSFWRRLRLIPFTRTVPEDRRVEGLAELLVRNEGPAILSWIVDGAVEAAGVGLVDPPSVLAATQEYAAQEDSIGRFVEECCEVGGGSFVRVKSSVLQGAYQKWCRQNGENELSSTVFGRELGARFPAVKPIRSNGTRLWSNVSLAPEWLPAWGGFGDD
ncbi:DNA polymerase/primase [Mycobacterium phage Aminay]|uniref:DNA primase n=1 Tax=Mycobacterium phage Aminay TaxID=2250291 RepID=A0A345KV54_9CAUD|nr:DNA polymerase/primase [Mycobacterium phage Aminay]AXH46906.1 DNA primase [Mycobacterium phage Aminay]